MKKSRVKTPCFDDLVFEFRNRDYGAYQLRKNYLKAVFTGFVISVIVGSLLVTVPFLIGIMDDADDNIISGGGSRYIGLEVEHLMPPEPEEIFVVPATPLPPSKPVAVQEMVQYVAPEVLDSIPEMETIVPVTMEEALASIEMDKEPDIYDLGFGGDYGYGVGGDASGSPFFIVEMMPSFRGGDLNSFREWVQKRTNYPMEAIQKKIQGRVLLTFIVEKDGSVSNVKIIKSVHPLIDNEAKRVIESSPKWNPGKQAGKPIRVRYSMWLGFVL